MVRAYALGQGAGTQVLVLGPGVLLFGEVLGPTRDLLMTVAWGINVGFAEYVIRRTRTARRETSSVTAAFQSG
jgi:hypothetical protein